MFWPLFMLQLAATGGIGHIAFKTRRTSWWLLTLGSACILLKRWGEYYNTAEAHITLSAVAISGLLLAGAIAVHREHAREVSDLHLLAESVPTMVWVSDASGEVTYANHHLLDYAGCQLEDFSHLRGLNLVHPDDRERVAKLWVEALRTGTLFESEHRLLATDGTSRWFIARAFPLFQKGRLVHWYGTATDIHDAWLLNERLKQLSA